MNRTSQAVIVACILLGVVYLSFLPAAFGGYGYMGYNGYHAAPSFWYLGGPDIYYERNVRSGSMSGAGIRGGGPGSGK